MNGSGVKGETTASSHGGIDTNLADVLFDLDTIDAVVLAQTQRIVKRAGERYLSVAQQTTPIGNRNRAGRKPLSTGWQHRVKDPFRVHVVNIRPHAHLAAAGFEHVGGDEIAPWVPWMKEAIRIRAEMVDELTALLGPNFPARLRAMEAVAGL